MAITRRWLVGAGAALAGIGPLAAACGPLGGRPGAGALVPKEQVQISFMTDWSSGPRLKVIEDAFSLWKQKYPNIAVEVRHGGYVQTKILADLAAGTQADVALYGGGGIATLREHFVDLMPFIKRDKFDTRDWLPVDPALLHEGGQYGMPFQTNMNMWIYNKTLFQQEGASPPTDRWTWNDVAEAAKRLTRRERQQWGIEICCPISSFLFADLLVSNGGNFIDKDRKRTLLNTPNVLEAGRWIVDRLHRDRTVITAEEAKTVIPQGLSFAFQSGRIGMIHINVGWVGFFESSIGFRQFDWDTMGPPKGPRTGKGIYPIGDQPHAMTQKPSRTQAQTDAAWLLTAYMSGPDVMALIAEGRGSVPVHRKVLNGERYLRRPPASMPAVPKMVDEAWYGVPWFKGIGEWRGPINSKLNEAWEGKLGIDDALRAATQEGDAKLAELATRP